MGQQRRSTTLGRWGWWGFGVCVCVGGVDESGVQTEEGDQSESQKCFR